MLLGLFLHLASSRCCYFLGYWFYEKVSFRNGFVVVYFRTWRKPEVFLRAVNTRFNAFGIMFWLICWAFSLFVWCVHLSRRVASLCAGLFYILVSAILHNETSPMFSFGGDTFSLRFATLISGVTTQSWAKGSIAKHPLGVFFGS